VTSNEPKPAPVKIVPGGNEESSHGTVRIRST
jgi:hypothetical protein